MPDLVGRVKLGKGVGLCGAALATGEAVYRGVGREGRPALRARTGLRLSRLRGAGGPAHADADGGLHGRPPAPQGRAVAASRTRRERDLGGYGPGGGRARRRATTTPSARASGSNRLGALSEVSRTIAQSPYLEEILQLLVNLTAQQFNFRVCTVRLLDETRGELVLRATQASAKAYQRKRAIKLGESIAGRAIDQNRPCRSCGTCRSTRTTSATTSRPSRACAR